VQANAKAIQDTTQDMVRRDACWRLCEMCI